MTKEICALPTDWHGAGSFGPETFQRLASILRGRALSTTAETGTGRTTLLFSHLSVRHLVFACDDFDNGGSLQAVRSSPFLRPNVVEFVVGFTQRTLPKYPFDAQFDAVLLDGPHGYPFPELEYFHFYPHIRPGGLLLLDDIQIATVHHLFEVLKADAMWRLVHRIGNLAVFERTDAPTFDPTGDGWWLQGYNIRRKGARQRLAALLPGALRRRILQFITR